MIIKEKKLRKKQQKIIKKKINRRNQEKYSALKPRFNLRTRFHELDYDYVDELSKKDKAWLNTFTEAYIHASITKKGKKLFRTKESRKEIYDRNNARNRCILSRAKACGKAIPLEEIGYDIIDKNNEDEMIEKLDKKLEKIKELSKSSSNTKK